MAINITSKRKPIIVNLVGERYMVKPVKSALALDMADAAEGIQDKDPREAIAMLYEWLKLVLTEKDVEAVHARLKDPDDDLDIEHITELLIKVSEHSVASHPST